jgi:hypothetical protein
MFSSVSGLYFSGHTAPPGIVPVPYNDEIHYVFPGSVLNNGSTLRSMTSNPYNLAAYPPYITTSSTPTPAYMRFPSSVSSLLNSPSLSITPSSDHQGTVTVWMYIPTASVTANASNIRLLWYQVPSTFDGIYLFAQSDASKNVKLTATTNGFQTDNPQLVPTNMPRDVWFMLTYVYIMNNTLPSSVWFNNTMVHTWTHPVDTMTQSTYYLTLSMLQQWAVRFNNFQMLGRGMTQAEVNAKFANERSYYGV